MSANGLDFTASGVQYVYVPVLQLAHMYPLSGPASGGTPVLLSGMGFARSSDLVCAFGDSAIVAAQWVHPTAVRVYHRRRRRRPSRSRCPTTSATLLKLTSCLNTSAGDCEQARARDGPDHGGTLVLVSGTGFVVDAPAAMCRFGADAVVPAVSVPDATTVLCQAPSHTRRAR